jgi:FAD/FMN-containing dehydrogenase
MTETGIATSVEDLAAQLQGSVIRPEDANYDEARAVYNAMIDKRPALIVRAANVDDVVAAVNYGRDQGLDIAIRGGGHNGAGLASVDDGLVIDLRDMNGVEVDAENRTAKIAGGALLGDVDKATNAHGLATPGGIISTTGAGGLMLGGGIGHLSRGLGLSIDNILGAEVVLADGSVVNANEDENPDLYWAIRGGGGNFGVVTSITARLHPIDTVVAGPMFWSLESTPELLRWYREFILNAPEKLNGFFAFLSVPPAEPFPEELHLQKVAAVVWCWSGAPEDADDALAEARSQPGLLLDGVQPMPLPALQSAFDPIFPAGEQWYWRADFVEEISDEAIEKHAEYAAKMPTWKSTMHLYPIDGAVHRVGATDTPWGYRNANWGQVIVGVDPDAANARTISEWAIEYHEALHPFSAGGAYVNMMMDEGQERVKASYGQNYDRLAKIKAEYDPANVFHVNQNIQPSS